MKNWLCIVLSVALLLSLVGCSTQPAVSDADSDVSAESTTEEATTTTAETTTTTEVPTTEEVTTTTAETTTTEATTTTATEATTTSNLPIRTTVSGPTKGISTMKGPNKGTVTFGTAPTTTVSTEATTTTTTKNEPMKAEPVLNKEYRCYIYTTDKDKEGNVSPLLILASVKFSESTCVIARHFYTGNPDNPNIDNTREPIKHGSTTYYFTNAAVQAPARYEVVGITVDVFNDDGSIAKTFSMPTNDSMECSFSDGVAFGRQNTFRLEE